LPPFAISFAIALVASLGITPPVRHFALHIGMVDHPGPRKVHQAPIPLLGGLAIYLAVLLASLVSLRGDDARSQILGILAGATLLAVVGILDDRGLLHHQIKLMLGMPVAALILLASGIRIHLITALFPSAYSGLLDAVLTVFWVVGITASFSILDHMDGLCAGTAAIAAGFVMFLAILHGQLLVGTLAAAVMGASGGFLRWNFSPAKIFMGDAGAMFLGFMLATLTIKLRFMEMAQSVSWMVPVLVLGVPVFDTTLVSISRARRGLIPFASPGKDHAAHRLANLGLGQRGAVLVLYGLGGLTGLSALLMTRLSAPWAWALGAGVAVAALLAVVALEYAPFERQAEPR
jgi:UDP-GlcNAc:undecaprenyl-phosphate GlcNAc-1-phosphate transferase